MAKYLCVKPGPVDGGIHRKAWTIRRRGLKVLLQRGRVDLVRGRLHWVGKAPYKKLKSFRSLSALREYVKKMLSKKRSHRYDKLPGRTRIHPPTRRG
jgi:hypothetical protein